MNEIFKLLKGKSSEWDSIGRAFGVSLNYRKELRKDISLDDCERLIGVRTERMVGDFNWKLYVVIIIIELTFLLMFL